MFYTNTLIFIQLIDCVLEGIDCKGRKRRGLWRRGSQLKHKNLKKETIPIFSFIFKGLGRMIQN
jgi:hypothetical protein